MKLNYKFLEWDSEFFGYKVAMANISEFALQDFEQLKATLKGEGYSLVYLYPEDKKSLLNFEKSYLKVLDTKVTFKKKLLNNHSKTIFAGIESYGSSQASDALKDLALVSGEYSRFKRDSNFKNREFERLYLEWLNKSISKEIADDIIVYKLEDKLNGFITYKIYGDSHLTIGLIATEPSVRGKGVGRSLMAAVEMTAAENKISEILVSTQELNKTAMAFYKGCGYTITEKKEILHLWL